MSAEEFSYLFYKHQLIERKQMKIFEKEKDNFLEQVNKAKAKTHTIHPESVGGCIRDHRKDIQKFISDAKSQKVKNIPIPSIIFHEGKFTFEKLYADWYTAIKHIVEKQQVMMRRSIDKWFNILNEYRLEDDFLKNENEEEAESSEDTTKENGSNFKWYMFLLIFCGIHSFFFYTEEDAKQCVLHPLECMENILLKMSLKLYQIYVGFHNIDSVYNSTTGDINE